MFTTAKVILIAGVVLIPTSLLAEGPPCTQRNILVERLNMIYGEKPVAGGIITATGTPYHEQVFELWADLNDGSWTIFSSDTGGVSCIIVIGDFYETGFSVPGKKL